MAAFDPAYDATNARERMALSNVATDRGGMTYGGIARRREPGTSWPGWIVIDRILSRGPFKPSAQELEMLSRLHRQFFQTEFWRPLNGAAIPDQGIAEKVYDAGVNCGTGSAARWLQVALNLANRNARLWTDVRVDGAIGPATLLAIEAASREHQRRWLVLQLFETQQEHHYFSLALADATQEENLLGWYTHRILHRAA